MAVPSPAENPTDPHLTLQLLTPPRPVSVTTTQRRDHQIPIRYHDGQWYGIIDVAGPDRVSGNQWQSPYAREYFRCVREDGLLVWLYWDVEGWHVHGWWD